MKNNNSNDPEPDPGMSSPASDARRAIVFGDLHGCLDELRELLDVARYDPGADRLVSLGDLLDRGPRPVEALRYVRDLGADVIMGNHEWKHVRMTRHAARAAAGGPPNPMRRFDPKRAAEHGMLTDDERAWMSALPAWLEIGSRWLLVHGGFLPGVPYSKQPRKDVCRVRWVDRASGKMADFRAGEPPPAGSVYWSELWAGPRSVIYGHNVHATAEPRVDRPAPGVVCLGIDTGCVYGGRLTAAILEGDEDARFVSVASHGKHAEMLTARV